MLPDSAITLRLFLYMQFTAKQHVGSSFATKSLDTKWPQATVIYSTSSIFRSKNKYDRILYARSQGFIYKFCGLDVADFVVIFQCYDTTSL